MRIPDKSNLWRVFQVQLRGDFGWCEYGRITLKPGESIKDESHRIELMEKLSCRLMPTIGS